MPTTSLSPRGTISACVNGGVRGSDSLGLFELALFLLLVSFSFLWTVDRFKRFSAIVTNSVLSNDDVLSFLLLIQSSLLAQSEAIFVPDISSVMPLPFVFPLGVVHWIISVCVVCHHSELLR